MSTTTTHPPDTRQLETVLPRLGLLERIALRIAIRGLLRLEREADRAAMIRRHELVIENERRRRELEIRSIPHRLPFR